MQISEQAHAGLLIDKNKSAEIAGKFLNARANGEEIVIGTEIADFVFDEGFLKPRVRIQARRAVGHVDIDDAEFPRVQIIHVHRGSDANAPIDGPEGGVPMEEIEGKSECLVEGELLSLAEKIGAAGLRGTDVAGRGDAALFDGRVGGRRNVQKCLAPENRLVALEAIAIEGVPPMACAHVRIFAAAAVAIPLGHGDVPAVRRGQEHFLRGRKNFRRGDSLPGFGVGTPAQFTIGSGRGHRLRTARDGGPS